MYALEKPGFTVEEVVCACASSYSDVDRFGRFAESAPVLGGHECAYDVAASEGRFADIATADALLTVSTDEMRALYTEKLVGGSKELRVYYDALMCSAPNGVCPYCGIDHVNTIDHFLAKAVAPLHSVTPVNLVPSCWGCNHSKGKKRSGRQDDFVLHPYYDTVLNEEFLVADVCEEYGGPVAHFAVEPHDSWDAVLAARVRSHFQCFNLADKCRLAAADELGSNHGVFVRLAKLGRDVLKAHLDECYVNCGRIRRNWWKTALYKALAESEWYAEWCQSCSG